MMCKNSEPGCVKRQILWIRPEDGQTALLRSLMYRPAMRVR